MKYTKTILALMAITLLFSCKKKEDEKKETPKTTDTISIVGKWKCLSAKGDKPIGYDVDGKPIYDFYEENVLPDCRRDDLTIFLEQKILDIEEGVTKCNSTDDQLIRSGIWSIKSDTLHMVILGKATDSKIIQLDKTTLKLQASGPFTRYYNDGSIDTVYESLTMISTYQRQ